MRKLQPKVDYHVVEGSGHFVMLEKPEVVNGHLLEFLNKHRLIRR